MGMGYNFAREVDRIARAAPDRTAVLCVDTDGGEQRITYGELRQRTNRLASGLAQSGVVQGDRVLVLLPRGIEPYVVYLALLKLGTTVMPGSEMLRGGDIRYRMQHAGTSVVIAHHTLTPELDAVRSECPTLRAAFSVAGHHAGWSDLDEVAQLGTDDDCAVDTGDHDMAFLSYTQRHHRRAQRGRTHGGVAARASGRRRDALV